MKLKTLLLTRRDIEKILDIRKAIPIVERAFRSHGLGRAQMPAKSYLFLRKFNGDFRSMPAYLEDLNAAGVKWVNAHPDNHKFKLPPVMALLILGDVKTGYPLAVMDATYLTNLRTGAGGAVAAKYLARRNSKIVAFVGTGNQARTQLEALRQLFKIKTIKVWSSDRSSVRAFVKWCRTIGDNPKWDCPLVDASRNIQACVKDADIIVTTTPSRKPFVQYRWVAKGAHVNAIGADAPGKQELDPAILRNAKVIVDDWKQAIHSGEVNVPISKGIISVKNIHASLGEVISHKKSGRTSKSEITVFDSTGLSIQDIACAHFIYKQALKSRLGKFISFF